MSNTSRFIIAQKHITGSVNQSVSGSGGTYTLQIALGRDDFTEAEFTITSNTTPDSALFTGYYYATTADTDAFSFVDTVVTTAFSSSYSFSDWRVIGLSDFANGRLSRSLNTADGASPYVESTQINGSNLEIVFRNDSGGALTVNANVVGRVYRRKKL